MHGDGRRAGGVYFEALGEGPFVLIAGGGPGVGHAHYHPWFDRLAGRFTVVFADYPGTGRSDDGEHGPEAYAAAFERVREALGAERWSIVALSFGGIPALAYALAHPERVERLVFGNAQYGAAAWQRGNIDNVNAALRRFEPARWEQALALRAAGVPSIDERYQELLEPIVQRMEWAGEPVELRRDPEERSSPDVYRAWLGDDPEVVVGGALAGYEPHLAAVRAPALVITGREDGMVMPELAAELHAGLADAELVVIDGAAHRPWAERPEEFFAAVEDFLA